MALSWIFLFYLIFFILSSKIKKKLVLKTQKQKKCHLVEVGAESAKIDKKYTFSPQGVPGQFGRFRPHFRRPPFRHQWVFGTQFFFPLKLRIQIFIFFKIYVRTSIFGREMLSSVLVTKIVQMTARGRSECSNYCSSTKN